MTSAEREPLLGVWGQSPQLGAGAKPLVEGLGGFNPPEADEISAMQTLILPYKLYQIW
jgi:hypothetical protein